VIFFVGGTRDRIESRRADGTEAGDLRVERKSKIFSRKLSVTDSPVNYDHFAWQATNIWKKKFVQRSHMAKLDFLISADFYG